MLEADLIPILKLHMNTWLYLKEINYAKGNYLKYGKFKYYVNDCLIVEFSSDIESSSEELWARCGRNSYTKEKCYASTKNLHFYGIYSKKIILIKIISLNFLDIHIKQIDIIRK
jgi:hypothetical protein